MVPSPRRFALLLCLFAAPLVAADTPTRVSLTNYSGLTGYGMPFSITALVYANKTDMWPLTGTITLTCDGQTVGSMPAQWGSPWFMTFAEFNVTATIPAGDHTLTATFTGAGYVTSSFSVGHSISSDGTSIDARPTTPVLVGDSPRIHVFIGAHHSQLVPSGGTVSVSEGQTKLGEAALGEGSTQVVLPPLSPGEHTLTVSYTGTTNFIGSTATAKLTVILPTMSIAGTHVSEGNSGLTTVSVPLTLSAAVQVPVRVSFTTVAGSATEDVDYVKASGVVEFAPGEKTHAITLQLIGDRLYEDDESFSVVISDPTNATIDTSSAIVIIANDDPYIVRRRPVSH